MENSLRIAYNVIGDSGEPTVTHRGSLKLRLTPLTFRPAPPTSDDFVGPRAFSYAFASIH